MAIDRRRLLLAAPLGVVALGGAGFYAMLRRMGQGNFDPHSLPSQLIGRHVPRFTLPAAGNARGFAGADLQAPGRIVLVNFFASWCVPCIEEARMLLHLSRQGIPIWGIAYKDKPADVARFLARHGNPYRRIVADLPGRVAINWGVYGVPETYLIDPRGIVRWRWAGAITSQVLAQDLRPLMRRYA
ncbi:MAG TPA: DsbE family thiol:disulfide interchange protein [Acetobacteraceae bacterium]|nr:DsbE family thiol:disulfide interchange protein [Acetobacteraceae bacterium]